MKKLIRTLIVILFVSFIFIPYGIDFKLKANTYNWGEDVWVYFYVPDSITGHPYTPDSIFYLMYDTTGVDTIRGVDSLLSWSGNIVGGDDGKHPGLYGKKITMPDSSGVFPLMIELYIFGRDSAICIPRIFHVAKFFDSDLDTISFLDSTLNLKDKVTLVDTSAGDISYIANNPDDFKSDISSLSTFDPASDKVTLVDTSAGDISYIANNPDDFKSDISSLSTIIGDSLNRLETTHGLGSWEGSSLILPDTFYNTIVEYMAGDGMHPCSLYALEADNSAIPNTWFKIFNEGLDAVIAWWYNDPNGLRVFTLDDGTYKVYPHKTGYTFAEIPLTITVSGESINDTLVGTEITHTPSIPGLCRVYGYIYDLQADSLSGVVVTAALRSRPPVRDTTGSIVSPYPVNTTTNNSGYWYIDLIPTSLLSPQSDYMFKAELSSGEILPNKRITVPDSTEWELQW
ncbi:MAG: hypothetical protein GF317_04895 [Candidatus Lokiarchaeota archaeon]|nr:hypothetical protein [Candidatus Lokiarchaeota archaeon]